MNKPTVIWIIGSNGTGKTTQAKLLGNFFQIKDLIITKGNDNGIGWAYSSYGNNIANLGRVQDTPCCGTDTLPTKEQIRLSYLKAIEVHNIVIIDGIMATGAWLEFIREKNVNIMLVLLETNIEDNVKRIRLRRTIKNQDKDINISKSTVNNLKGKIKSFQSLFKNISDKVESSIIIQSNLSPQLINNKIILEFKKLLDKNKSS
jgi:uridine kinase